ncbi:Ethanolamine ammonia-lyase light chain [Bienertia sinuspersici]
MKASKEVATVVKPSGGLERRRWRWSTGLSLMKSGLLIIEYYDFEVVAASLDPCLPLIKAGTQFWDEKLENELAGERRSSTAFDRYCMVLFAGIVAEALVYGEAKGGKNDENLFESICVLLQPPLSAPQSYNLLKWHKQAHKVAVKALESGGSLSSVIRSIKDALSSGE